MTEECELVTATLASFSCIPARDADKLRLTFEGTGDVSAVELLAGYLPRVHAEALRVTASEVICDVRKLTFMNSSCFKAFVVWIDGVKSPAPPYRIRFVTEPSLQWQRRSLEALRRLATDVVILEGGPSPAPVGPRR